MTTIALRRKAAQLAKQPYAVDLEVERLRDDSVVYVASVRELLGCRAQGATRQEAIAELDEVLTEYIESALEHGANVPGPAITRQAVRGRRREGGRAVGSRDSRRTAPKRTSKTSVAA